MDILSTFDVTADFFEVNPQLRIPFEPLLKDITNPSKYMWAVALFLHPDSKFANTDEEYRKTLIISDYYEDMDFESPPYSAVAEVFTHLCLTKPQKFLKDWEEKLEERAKFIASLPYNETTYELLDSMMSKTERMWKQYMNCLKDVEDEKTKSHTFGGAQESLTEQGLI